MQKKDPPSQRNAVDAENEHERTSDEKTTMFIIRDIKAEMIDALFSGKGRWLFTLLAMLNFGTFLKFMNEKNPAIYVPVLVKGRAVHWMLGGVVGIWSGLALYNWITWGRKHNATKR